MLINYNHMIWFSNRHSLSRCAEINNNTIHNKRPNSKKKLTETGEDRSFTHNLIQSSPSALVCLLASVVWCPLTVGCGCPFTLGTIDQDKVCADHNILSLVFTAC